MPKKKKLGITRQTAEDLVAELVKRAKEIDADPAYLYGFSRIHVFGSYLTAKERLGDIDIAVELGPKERDVEKHWDLCEEQSTEKKGRHANVVAQQYYSEEKTLKALRNHHTAFSFHEYNELVDLKADGTAESVEVYRNVAVDRDSFFAHNRVAVALRPRRLAPSPNCH